MVAKSLSAESVRAGAPRTATHPAPSPQCSRKDRTVPRGRQDRNASKAFLAARCRELPERNRSSNHFHTETPVALDVPEKRSPIHWWASRQTVGCSCCKGLPP